MSIEVDNAAQRLLGLAFETHGNQSTNNRTFLYRAPNLLFDNDPPPPHNLCNICQSMRFVPPSELPIEEAEKARLCFPNLMEWEFNRRLLYFHQPSLAALYNSSENGCHCCLLIWKNMFSELTLSPHTFLGDEPVILGQLLAALPSVEKWNSDWYPGDGSALDVFHANKQYAFARLHFLSLKSQSPSHSYFRDEDHERF